MVAWKSSTGTVALTHRSRVAGPTTVVAVVKGAVWKAIPSAAGTGVQSQGGLAAQAFAPAGRLVAGRPLGLTLKGAVVVPEGSSGCNDSPGPR